MRKLFNKTTKYLSVLAIVTMAIVATTIHPPIVEAASETNKTETVNSQAYISDTEDQLALSRAITIDEAKKKAQDVIKELSSVAAQSEEEATEVATEAETTVVETEETETDSVDNSSSTNSSDSSYVAGTSGSGYLMDISNPDPSYTSYAINLSDADRDLAERIVMGEAGSCGYTGMALVAQCLRDAFVTGGYSSIKDVISSYGYYGSTSITPSSTCKEVINYVFDQGGSAVQHRILTFYASNYCSSSWHETQNFICSWDYVRFFDSWY